ncbi:PREDICTED: RNA polymerase II elongation factor ELL2 [Myotis brandtii]|uniref:RNA polymerase II elongation factor ELL2 n=1 Tax=Myotis brandtii TaxID=109478 RepID=UPI0003BC0435|nr:PREDICTED: RNA polymerase II elongation factor ELL2 [Myotis brandtii]
METSGIRAMQEAVYREGEVSMEKVDSLEPRLDNVTVQHMQLTRSAIQTIDSYQNHDNIVPLQVSLQSQGLQGLTNIPPNNSPTDVYKFNFQLSNMNNKNREDHNQQTDSSCSPSELSCMQLMPDEIVCRTANSYPMTQVRKAQKEEEFCKKLIKIRPRVGKRMPVRKITQMISDPTTERKRTTPINPAYTIRKSRATNSVYLRPYRDRVIHLLALKDYKKPELLLRLQKDGIQKRDSNSLGKILQQVANLNTHDFSYTLKDNIFKELQRDWPGYNEIERKSLELVLSKKVGLFQNVTGTNYPDSSISSSTDETSSSQEQFYNSVVIDPLRKKKVRIAHMKTTVQSSSNGYLNNSSKGSAVDLPSPSEATANPILSALSVIHFPISNSSQPVHSNSNSCNTARDQGSQDPYVVSFSQNSICENQCDKHSSLKTLAPIPTQIKFRNLMENKHLMSNKFQYKIMEHKVNSQEYHIEVMEKQKTDSERQSEGANPESCEEVEQVSADSGNTCSTSGLQDYLTNYVTIVSSEQRQHYKQEFKAEYDEYRALYDKMQTVSSIFTNLDSKRKHLPPDSKEYDKITKKMSLEYHKMRQIHPNYFSERYRYQYLYKKLAHIKRLIKDYDKQQVQ